MGQQRVHYKRSSILQTYSGEIGLNLDHYTIFQSTKFFTQFICFFDNCKIKYCQKYISDIENKIWHLIITEFVFLI